MGVAEILQEFAKEHNINTSEVNKFLVKYNTPKTLEELLQIPTEMLNHSAYYVYLDEPLQEFIGERMGCERYQTVTLERVVDRLKDAKADAEGDEDTLEELAEVEQCIIDTKFGSAVYDW